MMALPSLPLAASAEAQLARWQNEIDVLVSYADQVIAADKAFGLRNRKRNQTFAVVRAALTAMCFGERRCCYCEDSLGDEVDHVAPKNLYPDKTFQWTNYLYACGPCNGPKKNQYAVFDANGLMTEVTRPRGGMVVPPVAGSAVLINPRLENPADFFELDLSGPNATFFYVPKMGISSDAKRRALWTRCILGLNRAEIAAGRRNHYDTYISRLRTYAIDKAAGHSDADLEKIKRSLLKVSFPSVFREMQSQSQYVAELQGLFAPIPEAVAWTHH